MAEFLNQVWLAILPFQDLIKALLISVCSAGILALFKPRVKLIWGSTSKNFHRFPLGDEGQVASIWTEKFFVQNIGKRAANSIEVVLSIQPTSYNLFPPREHKATALADGNFSIGIPSIAPKELIVLDMIDIEVRQKLDIVAVNCADALSQEVEFSAMRQFGKWVHVVVYYLMFSGFVGSVYLLLKLLLRAA